MTSALAVPEGKLLDPQLVPPGLERWHIDDVRYTKQGKVRLVHHVIWGWMKPRSLYFLEKLHDLFPGANASANSIAHGGYIFKSAVVSTSPSVLGFSLPVGLGIYSWASVNLYNNINDGRTLIAQADSLDRIANAVSHGPVEVDLGSIFPEIIALRGAKIRIQPDPARIRAMRDTAAAVRQDGVNRLIEAGKWGGAMALPFGDIWLLYKVVQEGVRVGGAVKKLIDDMHKAQGTDAAAQGARIGRLFR